MIDLAYGGYLKAGSSISTVIVPPRPTIALRFENQRHDAIFRGAEKDRCDGGFKLVPRSVRFFDGGFLFPSHDQLGGRFLPCDRALTASIDNLVKNTSGKSSIITQRGLLPTSFIPASLGYLAQLSFSKSSRKNRDLLWRGVMLRMYQDLKGGLLSVQKRVAYYHDSSCQLDAVIIRQLR